MGIVVTDHNRRRLVLAGAALSGAPLTNAFAQTGPYPNRPVKIVVGAAPGGLSDAYARLFAEQFTARFGQPCVVENRPGASGRIAVEAFKGAAPDGGTLLFAPIFIPVIAPLVLKDLRYDPVKDLVPVTQVAKYEFAFAVGIGHPARTLGEFVAWAKANPARATIGNSAPGSLPHFVAFELGRAAGIDLVHVPYKGVTRIETEVMGGQIAAGVGTVTDLAPLHRAGKLRILATAGATRAALLPDVPTFRESGYPTVRVAGWHGVYAPAGTPQAVVDGLSGVIAASLKTAAMRERFAALGLEPTGTTPRELAAIMAADSKRWTPIIRAAGFSASE